MMRWQTPAALLLIITGVVLYWYGSGSADSAPPHTTPRATVNLLPDVGGPITAVTCQISSARQSSLRNASLVTGLVNALPPRVRFHIMTSDPDAFEVRQNPHPDRVRFETLPAAQTYSIWPQDPFLVLHDTASDRPILLTPAKFERGDDRLFADALAASTDADIRTTDLLFEGGNIVSDERRVFIGVNTIAMNAAKHGLDATMIVRQFEQLLGKPAIVVGPFPQPVGHIDMVLTPLGTGELLLADPGAGARIAARLLKESTDVITEFERSCQSMFFGHAKIDRLVAGDGEVIEPPRIEGATAAVIEACQDIAPLFDALAEQLTQHGYRVHRVPWLGRPDLLSTQESADSTARPGPGYPMLSYNNVLLEEADGHRQVYLPRYGLAALDAAADETWRSLGFSVRPVDGLTISAMYGGSLRCCVKVLRRASVDLD